MNSHEKLRFGDRLEPKPIMDRDVLSGYLRVYEFIGKAEKEVRYSLDNFESADELLLLRARLMMKLPDDLRNAAVSRGEEPSEGLMKHAETVRILSEDALASDRKFGLGTLLSMKTEGGGSVNWLTFMIDNFCPPTETSEINNG